MTDVLENDDIFRRPSVVRPFAGALRTVVITWVIAFVPVTAVIAIFGREILVSSTIIAVASGVIAVAAMLPGILSVNPQANKFFQLVMFGIAHRFTGTVALFLLCRYHMAAAAEMIAVLIIGWYLVLTVVEVISLARELPKIDGCPGLGSSLPLSADT